MKKLNISQIVLNTIFICVSLLFILPFMLIISASLTNEQTLVSEGFKLLPPKLDFSAYFLALQNPNQIAMAYLITAIQTALGTLLSLVIMSLCAYPLSRPSFPYKKIVTTMLLIPMFFGGGLIPSYIINTKYLGLGNSIWIYILPGLVSTFQIVIIRTFFQGLPNGLVDAAKIDGAGEYRILWTIITPISTPVLATIGAMLVLSKWNNWMTSLIYIKNENLFLLQYLLQKILREAEYLNRMASDTTMSGLKLDFSQFPAESLKFAMCVIVAGPMLFVFPFFQKYFAKGLTVGSVKG